MGLWCLTEEQLQRLMSLGPSLSHSEGLWQTGCPKEHLTLRTRCLGGGAMHGGARLLGKGSAEGEFQGAPALIPAHVPSLLYLPFVIFTQIVCPEDSMVGSLLY